MPMPPNGIVRIPTYPAIGDYGLIGNTHTAALVSRDGAVEWLCIPRFDSPSVLAALLDREKGGRLRVTAVGAGPGEQRYIEDTNVLVTRLEGPQGVVEVTDWMPCWDEDGAIAAAPALQRLLICKAGSCDVVLEFAPRLNYGRERGRWQAGTNEVTVKGRHGEFLHLSAPRPLAVGTDGRAECRFVLNVNEEAFVTLAWEDGPRDTEIAHSLQRTMDFWRGWLRRLTYDGPYREEVARSALALKLLTYSPTGAIIAAPTTSLPEAIGGPRNWDYRYTWLRDATLTLNALHGLGFKREAERFTEWMAAVVARERPGELKIMYRVDGSSRLRERCLDHLEGYRGSRPVRVGNGAANQRQLDVFGEALNCLYLCGTHHYVHGRRTWEAFADLADHVAREWPSSDSGIWEVRSAPRHFVYSKAMCWVALDRAYRAACELGVSHRCEHWREAADDIRSEVLRSGFDFAVGSFIQAFDGRAPDASLLLLPLAGFIDPNDKRVEGTVAWLRETLDAGGGLLYRYRGTDDGVGGGDEGAFTACSFWLVSCLAHMGRRGEARELFDQLLKYASPLGLYSEEIDPATGQLLGNYPQALTHIALINAAIDIEGCMQSTRQG